jgi:hypothetical protein
MYLLTLPNELAQPDGDVGTQMLTPHSQLQNWAAQRRALLSRDAPTIRRADEDVRQGDHSHASSPPSDDWCDYQRARPHSPVPPWASCP